MVYTSKFQVPWGAIYKAMERAVPADEKGHELLRVYPEESGPLLFGRSTAPWKLVSCTVSQTRYWACSTAQFVVARPILTEADKNLDLDTVSGLLGKAGTYYFDCRPEDAIIIDLGYADAPYTDSPKVGISRRVFYGVVDTVKVTANSRGVKITVSCRDVMRYLIDNKFSGSLLSNGLTLTPHAAFDNVSGELSGQIAQLNPSEVQKALLGLDSDGSQTTTNPAIFLNGSTTTSTGDVTLTEGNFDKHKIMAWIIYAGSGGACLPAPLVENDTTFKNAKAREAQGVGTHIERSPLEEGAAFERSTRPMVSPKDVNSVVQGMNVMNRFPLEVLKHLGALEAEPRELYADIDTGRICWRRKRTFRTDSKERRVFTFLKPVYKGKIDGITDAEGYVQPNVIGLESDWSTVGTISEVVVINPQANSKGSRGANESSGVLNAIGRLPDERYFRKMVPLVFPGLRRFVRRSRFIFDDTMTGEDPNNAMGLIEAFLRIWGKDIRAGTFTIPGDATIRPGHAVELHNFGIPKVGETMAAHEDGHEYFRVEAVVHKMTAAGPNKGFRTQIAWAEADETRQGLMELLYSVLGETNPQDVDLTKAKIDKTKATVGRKKAFSKKDRGAVIATNGDVTDPLRNQTAGS